MLEQEITIMIIDVLQLEDIAPDAIDPDAPLFGDGLGLDSLDALELGIALQERYGVTLPADALAIEEHLTSVRALSALIVSQRAR